MLKFYQVLMPLIYALLILTVKVFRILNVLFFS